MGGSRLRKHGHEADVGALGVWLSCRIDALDKRLPVVPVVAGACAHFEVPEDCGGRCHTGSLSCVRQHLHGHHIVIDILQAVADDGSQHPMVLVMEGCLGPHRYNKLGGLEGGVPGELPGHASREAVRGVCSPLGRVLADGVQQATEAHRTRLAVLDQLQVVRAVPIASNVGGPQLFHPPRLVACLLATTSGAARAAGQILIIG
mmetsp:Transcript_24001/g.60397  ORF Transcript_24001/g.60397 Transcript_24001/m.60397 type:complete len:204 (-) Transcript_24001:2922-3533(-)